MPAGYRPVHVNWKDLDKCNVCHMDEEYANKLFLQCDKCRMMSFGYATYVVQGHLKFLHPAAFVQLQILNIFSLLETCLSDIKKMEPVDGMNKISKDRWKLLCSIYGVPYGACIQCSNNACYVAYHPLCSRAVGFCAELANVDRLQVVPLDEDEENQCIRLLSFCKRHSPNRSTERVAPDERIGQLPKPVQPTSQPVLNTPRPALAPHLQLLLARNGYLDGASGM
ncbi:histone-lysine N-methyltransferase ATX2-like protein isoform X1 [Tanacetum coccineum]